MNSGMLTGMMQDLRSEDKDCPYCKHKKPRHESDCIFRDFNLTEALLEVYLTPSVNSDDMKTFLYEFIRERSDRDFFLDAICYSLTTDHMYDDIGITEEDMVFLVHYMPIYYSWWLTLVHYVVVRKPFFRKIDDNSKDTALKALETITMLCDIKGSEIGEYEENTESINQIKALRSLHLYIERWINKKKL